MENPPVLQSRGHIGFVSAVLIAASLLPLSGCGSPEERAAGYVAKAQQYFDAGDYKNAQIEARNAIQVTPKDVKARYLMALLAEKADRADEMSKHLLIVVDEDPKHVDARVKLGNLMFLGRAYDGAAEQAKALRELAPEDVRGMWLNSRVLWQKGDRAAAIAQIEEAVRKAPDESEGILLQASFAGNESREKGLAIIDAALPRLSAEQARQLRELRANVLEEQGKLTEADATWQTLIEQFPDRLDYANRLADSYTRQGKVDDAEKLLRDVATNATDDGKLDAQRALVRFLGERKGFEAAEQALDGFIKATPDSMPLRLELGRLYETNGKADKAQAAYQQIADREPKSPEGLAARTRIAGYQLLTGKAEQASALLDEVLADMPDNVDALILRASIRAQSRQFDEAIADLRMALRRQPDAPQALLLLARVYDAAGETALAGDTYRDLVEVYPAERTAILELSTHYVRQGQAAEAEAVLRDRSPQLANDPEIQNRLVDSLISQGKFQEAEKAARRLAELTPTLGVGDYQVGRALAGLKDYNGANAAFRRALQKVPDSVPAVRGLADSLARSGRQAEAVKSVTDFIAKNPTSTAARLVLGQLHEASGNRDAATRAYEDVIAERPDEIGAYLGLARLSGEDAARRIEVLQRGVASNPGNPEMVILLGGVFEAQKRFEDAIQLYESAVARASDSLPLVNNLAALLLDQRKDTASWKRALELSAKLQESEDPIILDTVGWANYRNGEVQRAITYLERAVSKGGSSPLPHYHLGMAYAADENTVNARQELEKALKMARNQEFTGIVEAREMLARLQ
jgi:putative PEP-CTERM system TPR-repeat lipoprotein